MAQNANNEEFKNDYVLPVFTVSSMDYQKMIGNYARDGGPDTFHDVESTEIPKLQVQAMHILLQCISTNQQSKTGC